MTADIRINMKNEENHNYKLICRISETSSPLATTSRRDHCLQLNVVELYKRERQKTEKSQRAAGNPEFPRQDAFLSEYLLEELQAEDHCGKLE